jgi:pantothenate kinase
MNHITAPDLTFPLSVTVTDQIIDTSFLSSSQQEFYKNLFVELLAIYSSKGQSRMLIGLAGPTGSGKSVIATLFQEFAQQLHLPFAFQVLGIDAFHYRNSFLESHRDNNGTILKERKGRYDTYDVPKLLAVLHAFKGGQSVSLPEYSRKIHDPIEDRVTVSTENALLLVEGLWLLYDHNEWDQVAPLLDYKIFIEADKEKVKDMVVRRHERGGRSNEGATLYYDTVDASNFKLVMPTKEKADKVITSYNEVV